MLSIFFKNDKLPIIDWHVGEVFPIFPVDVLDAIVMVQADGHELEHIYEKTNWVRIPRPVVKWFGDDAKFIVANLLDLR